MLSLSKKDALGRNDRHAYCISNKKLPPNNKGETGGTSSTVAISANSDVNTSKTVRFDSSTVNSTGGGLQTTVPNDNKSSALFCPDSQDEEGDEIMVIETSPSSYNAFSTNKARNNLSSLPFMKNSTNKPANNGSGASGTNLNASTLRNRNAEMKDTRFADSSDEEGSSNASASSPSAEALVKEVPKDPFAFLRE